MPTVPTISQPAAVENAPVEVTPVSAMQTESVRRQLAQKIQQQVAKTGTVSGDFLDQFATSHLDKSAADTPAAWDYAALRHSAQQEEQKQQHQQQLARLDEEATWTKQVGVLTANNAALESYLALQLPVYQQHLQQSGIGEKQAAQAANQLRSQTIAQHISRSLSGGDWQTAGQVLAAQGAHLSDEVRQRCQQQVRQSFVHDQALHLWQRAWQEAGSDIALAKQQAMANVSQTEEALRQPIMEQIHRLAEQQQRRLAAERADVFAQLAGADTLQTQQRLLAAQTVLDNSQLAAANQALQTQQQPANTTQQEWFMRHYFQDNTDAEKALSKGWCTARDYFRLKSAQQARQSGEDFPAQQWLCRGIETWMNKQGFQSQDITRVSYAVLCSANDQAGRLECWQQIKKLLTC